MSNYTIPLSEGIALTTAYRASHPGEIRAFTIDKAEVEELFSNSNAVEMRAYLGEDANGLTLVMVGVDEYGKDIVEPVYDYVKTCPDICDEASPLNIGV